MKLFLITQTEYEEDYNMYTAAIVAARNEEEAKLIHPSGDGSTIQKESNNYWVSWVSSVEYVGVKEVGTAKRGTKQGDVILACFRDE